MRKKTEKQFISRKFHSFHGLYPNEIGGTTNTVSDAVWNALQFKVRILYFGGFKEVFDTKQRFKMAALIQLMLGPFLKLIFKF